MATWLRSDPDDVRLWPLGNMVGPSWHGSRSADNISVALAGPVVNAAVVLITSLGLGLAFGARFVWNPLGNGQGSGAPLMSNGAPAPALSAAWFIGWFGYLNWVLLLANLIPALPFDGGRVLRSFLASSSVSPAKDVLYAPMTAHVCATLLGLAGLVRLLGGKSDGITFISLALLIELMVRTEARILEDGGFFEDGIFGYDFSEGYTSLEGSAAKVRPYRESALEALAAAAVGTPPQAPPGPRGRRGAPDGRDPREAPSRGPLRADRRGAPVPGPRQHQVSQQAQGA